MAQEKKSLLPDAASQQQSRKSIQSLFKDEYSKGDRESRRALSQKLFRQALQTSNDPTGRYVLLTESRELSIQSVDVATLVQAIDRTYQLYDHGTESGRGMILNKSEGLAQARRNAKTREEMAGLSEAFLRVAEDAVVAGDFDTAASSAKAAEQLARASKESTLAAGALDLSKEIPALKEEALAAAKAELSLAVNADDPSANLVMGRYLCFIRREWTEGLAYLAKSSEASVREAARADAALTPQVESMAQAADGWWAASQGERNPLYRKRYRGRAWSLYIQAIPKAAGLLRTKLEKRLEEFGSAATSAIVELLQTVDLQMDVVQGEWRYVAGSLLSPDTRNARLQFPYLPPPEYDLKIIAARAKGTKCFAIGLVWNDRQFLLVLDGWDDATSGFELVDGKPGFMDRTFHRGKVFTDEKPKAITCSVRKTALTVAVDGKAILDWKGESIRLSLAPHWTVPHQKALFVASHQASYSMTQATLIVVSGQGRSLR